MWSTVGSVTKLPPLGALGGPDEVLGRQDAQRLAHRAAADAELAGEHASLGSRGPAAELAADDQSRSWS